MSPKPPSKPSATGDGASLPAPAAALARLSQRAQLAAAFASGAAMGFAQPPWGLWPLFFLACPAALWLWRAALAAPRPGRASFWTGWAFGAGHFSVALHWIVEPFLVDAATHGWMAPFAFVILNGGLGLFWGTAFWSAGWVAGRADGPLWKDALLLALAVVSAEFIRSWIFTGFPWALAVYGWIDTPVSQTGALIGPYAVTLLTFAAAFATGAGGAGWRRALGPVAAAALVTAGWGWGAWRLGSDAAQTPPSGPLIRVVQTHLHPDEKWAPGFARANLDMLLAASGGDLDEPPAVTVWPESAVTFILDRAPEAVREIANRMNGGEVATGALRPVGSPATEISEATRWRNSLFLIQNDGTLSAPFDKIHLVPFGEYFPFDSFFNSLGVVGFGGMGGGLLPGDRPVAIQPAGAPAFAPLICYEMIFPRETMAAAEATNADWMVLVTNDGWFGAYVGPMQHLAMARARAIETGLPIARSANSGVSAMIDPFGRHDGNYKPSETAVQDSNLPERRTTHYRAYGEAATTLVFLYLLIISTLGRKRSISG